MTTAAGSEAPSGTGLPEAGPVRTSFAEEVALHEGLLRRGTPASRVAVLGERVVSFGVSVPSTAAYLRRARERGIRTGARTTGGTGVLHLADDILWAVVLPRTDPRVGRDFARAYGRLGRGVVRGLAQAGVHAEWLPAFGLTEDYCPLSSRGEVLVVDGKVVGAAAQHLTSSALLHQGSVSWEVDRGEVDRLFALRPGGPSVHLGGLAGSGKAQGPDALASAIGRALDEEVDGGRPAPTVPSRSPTGTR